MVVAKTPIVRIKRGTLSEEEMGKKMLALAQQEMELTRMKWGGNAMRSATTTRDHFGRVKVKPKNRLKLTNIAAMINKMLAKDLTVEDIAEVVGAGAEYVRGQIQKYDLPRTGGTNP